MLDSPTKPDLFKYDPTFLHARREAIVIVALFAVFCIWSISVCYGFGYLNTDEHRPDIATTFGMPSWVFWGICLPWIVVDVVAVWFCFFFMQDDDLGEDHEGEDLAEQVADSTDGEEASHA